MNELVNKARHLLESGTVKVVIGYEKGSAGRRRPAFITDAAGADRLVFDDRCTQNLAVYLTKDEIRRMGRAAIVAPIPVLRSILQLERENQIRFEDLVLLGISGNGVPVEFRTHDEVRLFVKQSADDTGNQQQHNRLERLKSMRAEDRMDFWKASFESCFRCYACRAVCPLCYCTRCRAENNQPQWVPVASHTLGNLEWHIMRAMHLAGRCTNCGSCTEACPAGIPLDLLNMFMAGETARNFGSPETPEQGSVLSVYSIHDKDNFIL